MTTMPCLPVAVTPSAAEGLERFGWVLLHSVWQVAAVAAVLAVILRIVPRSSTVCLHVRYVACLAALVALPVLAAATFVQQVDASACKGSRDAAAGASRSPGDPHPGAAALVRDPRQPDDPPTATARDEDLEAVAAASVAGARSLGQALTRFEPWLPVMAICWLAGIVAIACRMSVGWALARRLVRRSVADRRLRSLVDRWRPRLGIPRQVRVLVSQAIDVPVLIGVVRPVILWPAAAFSGFSPEHIEAILVHELAHVRRHDALVNLLQAVIETIFFHHPAAWWISAQVRGEREHCADDLAVTALGRGATGARLSYATALVLLEERRRAAPTLAVASAGGCLVDRVRRLAGVTEPAVGSARFAAGVMLAAVAFLLMTGLGSRGPTVVAEEVPQADAGPDLLAVTTLTVEEATALVARQAAKPSFPGIVRGRGRGDVDAALAAAGMTAESVARLRGLGEARRQASLRHTNRGDVAVLHDALRRQESVEWLGIRNLFANELFLPAMTEVSPPVAAALARFGGNLFLPGLKTLTPEAAAAFAAHAGQILGFEGLESLSVAAATALVGHRGVLIVSVRGGLTPEIVRELAQKPLLRIENIGDLSPQAAAALVAARGPKPLSLAGFTSFAPEVAASVARLSTSELDLGGVRVLSPESLAALRQLKCPRINLGGLQSLPAALATEVAQLSCNEVELSGLAELSAEAGAALAAYKGQRICLNGLERLSVDAAESLAGFAPVMALGGPRRNRQATEIQLSGLKSLDRRLVEAFATYGGLLYLGGLAEVDVATAEALAARDVLELPGLVTLEPPVAAALAKQQGRLRLPGLERLSVEAARALAPHRGELDLGGLDGLSAESAAILATTPSNLALNGLTEVPAGVAAELAKRTAPVTLNGLTTVSVESARALAGWRGQNISLYGLRHVDPEVAAILLSQPRLVFNVTMVETLTPRLLEALGQRMPNQQLTLPRVTSLETRDAVEIAAAVAKFPGPVFLPNLKRISPKALGALIEKPDLRLPNIDTLELIAEPDGSPTEDFVVSEEFLARQQAGGIPANPPALPIRRVRERLPAQ